jgi:hypothetical protein
MSREIKSMISMTRVAFKKNTLFITKLDGNLRKTLVNCYTWSIILYGAETWTLRKADKKHRISSEMWRWRRMGNIRWRDCVKNEVLHRVKKERCSVKSKEGRKEE